ncbi:MAG: bifunctional phosphopantothenoylcysteine decarboxylase/phosphopantothenate--cysteine ligase CoaBC [Gammaproteobacteria bacterium]|nr:MAG: bifunctional phosphopantothenoylcysteine decarboxylase/phosphopantothenate--cysteine ligase CoaBC [Gammaproteobacteria bacterium]
MDELNGKKILLGISGGIAAYKSIELIRRLNDSGAEVRVVMTKSATEFVTPLTFEAISGNPVHVEMFGPRIKSAIEHVELARWADLIVIAPATANVIAKLTHGIADDLLTTVCLALTDIDLAVAPAMNLGMWKNPATQENIASLSGRGIKIWGPAEGFQACGEIGSGRMIEAAELADHVRSYFAVNQTYGGVKVVITAGPTREPLDPVRFITNRSSGKMGYEIASACAERGAEVVLVSGPVSIAAPEGIKTIDVETAQEMHDAVFANIVDADIYIGTAAVADYRAATPAEQKIKKSADELSIELTKNPDILADVAAMDTPPFTVGFAAETNDIEIYAKGKLQKKKLKMIAANQVGVSGTGFDSDNNKLHVYWNGGDRELPLASKAELARELVALIMEHYDA